MIDFSTTPISAIFVFHDPRNWALDIQIIIDVIQSRGVIDRPRPLDGAPPVELIFCNPDLLWRSEFPRPRLGQGAFREAFQAVFKVRLFFLRTHLPSFLFLFFFLFSSAVHGIDFIQAVTGAPYPHVQYGKPTKHTYDFAEMMLRARMKELHGPSGPDIQPRLSVAIPPLFLVAHSEFPAYQLYDWR